MKGRAPHLMDRRGKMNRRSIQLKHAVAEAAALTMLAVYVQEVRAQAPSQAAPAQRAQTSPNCSEAPVTYSTFDLSFAKRIVLETTTDVPKDGIREFAPQDSRWLMNVGPSDTRSGFRTGIIYIGSARSHEALKMSFVDISEYPVQVRWLNEKLLFGRVWWGRILSTDFILDVEKRHFIYEEMANYFGVANPCPKAGVNR